MSEGFLTSLDIAELFYRYCHDYNITDRATRIAVLRELVRQKQVAYIRDTHSFLAGKRILKITNKRGQA